MRGRDKLLERVSGKPLLRKQAEMALKTGHSVAVALPPNPGKRLAVVAPLTETSQDLEILFVPDAKDGMSGSVRAGAALAERLGVSAMMICHGDMPDLRTSDLNKLIECHNAQPNRIIRATSETGKPGHPVLMPKRLLESMQLIRGDQGPRAFMQLEKPILVPLSGDRAVTDLDTPEDWAAWRAAQPEFQA